MLTQLVMTHQLVLYVRSLLLWLFEAQDNEVSDKLLDHLTFSSKKGTMRQLLLTACFWATVCGSYQLYMEDCPWTLLQELCWSHRY